MSQTSKLLQSIRGPKTICELYYESLTNLGFTLPKTGGVRAIKFLEAVCELEHINIGIIASVERIICCLMVSNGVSLTNSAYDPAKSLDDIH
jgi:hypothetical protein